MPKSATGEQQHDRLETHKPLPGRTNRIHGIAKCIITIKIQDFAVRNAYIANNVRFVRHPTLADSLMVNLWLGQSPSANHLRLRGELQ